MKPTRVEKPKGGDEGQEKIKQEVNKKKEKVT
jgi:hypothetical protein